MASSCHYTAVSVFLFLFGALVFGDCPEHWEEHGSCYMFSDSVLSWTGAVKMCELFDASLAEVDDVGEMDYLDRKVKEKNGQFWIGALDVIQEGKFFWATSQRSVTIKHFGGGEPNDSGHNEDCVEIRPDTFWNDEDCMSPRRYICERLSSGEDLIG